MSREHKYQGNLLKLGRVTSGVPQGSVLAPLLFPTSVNGLPVGIQSYLNVFANNARILKDVLRSIAEVLVKMQQWLKQIDNETLILLNVR